MELIKLNFTQEFPLKIKHTVFDSGASTLALIEGAEVRMEETQVEQNGEMISVARVYVKLFAEKIYDSEGEDAENPTKILLSISLTPDGTKYPMAVWNSDIFVYAFDVSNYRDGREFYVHISGESEADIITGHADEDRNRVCDHCGEEYVAECTEHTDTERDHKCDYCEAEYTADCSDHTDANRDHKCDYCDAEYTEECTDHVDEDSNSLCDYCLGYVGSDEGREEIILPPVMFG